MVLRRLVTVVLAAAAAHPAAAAAAAPAPFGLAGVHAAGGRPLLPGPRADVRRRAARRQRHAAGHRRRQLPADHPQPRLGRLEVPARQRQRPRQPPGQLAAVGPARLRGPLDQLARLQRLVRHAAVARGGRLRPRVDPPRRHALRGPRRPAPRRPAGRRRPRRPRADRRARRLVRRRRVERARDAAQPDHARRTARSAPWQLAARAGRSRSPRRRRTSRGATWSTASRRTAARSTTCRRRRPTAASPRASRSSRSPRACTPSGNTTGFYAPPGADPDADLTSWFARIGAGEPYDGDPVITDIADEIYTHHSSISIDRSVPPPPIFVANGWTDDLFPVERVAAAAQRRARGAPATRRSR